MSDDLKKFLKKHDVQMDAPHGEWTQIRQKISEKENSRSNFWSFTFPGKLTYALASFAVGIFVIATMSQRLTPAPVKDSAPLQILSDAEAGEFLEETFADFDDENDFEEEDIFEL